MQPLKNYYAILGIESDASPEAIKSAYYKRALEFHPDKHPGDKTAAAHFSDAAEAYGVLRNPAKRSSYDVEWRRVFKNNEGGLFNNNRGLGPNFNTKTTTGQPAPGVSKEEADKRLKDFLADMQAKNEQMKERLKGTAPKSPSGEPSLEELKQDAKQGFIDMFRNAKKKFGF